VVHDRTLQYASVFGNDVHFAPELGVTVNIDSDASHGTVDLAPDGTFTYMPEAGFVGTDTFTYTVNNGVYTSKPADVAIDVTNDPPYVADYLNAPWQNTVSGADGDGDPISYVLVEGPDAGTGDFSLNEDTGEYVFEPGADFKGYARFI
jgi:hypothetical protein